MKEKKTKLKFRKIIIFILLFIIAIFLWARYINTTGLKTYEYGITNKDLPKSFNGLKIIHFSDIQYGQTTNLKDIKKLVKNINKLKPDIVFFTGDLFNKNITLNEKDKENLTKELLKIEATLYKYTVSGDSDQTDYNSYKNIMENANFILLNNSNELLYYKSETPIKIVGLNDTKDLENAFKEENPEQSFTLLLMHKPDMIDDLNNYKVDIAFAGHSLGGQLRIPFLGGIIKKDGAKKYVDRYYDLENTEFYVSSGIGTENIKFRTFNKPSFNLYRIYSR